MKFSRRSMILSGVAAGGGLAVAYGLSTLEDGDERKKFGASTPDQFVLHAYVKIAKDGTVTVAVPQAELGQGVTTAIPMLVAEELDADWANVRAELSPTADIYFMPGDIGGGNRQMAGNSYSISRRYLQMRYAGAMAREMLIAAAATVGWIMLVRWRIARHPSVLWRAVVLSSGGVILCWLLLMTLWLPWLNYGKSYAGVSHQIGEKLPVFSTTSATVKPAACN